MREPTAILHRIAAESARLLATERVSINIPNDPEAKTGWTWYTPTEIGVDPWSAEDSIGIDEGICGLAITTGQTVITGDYLNDTRFIQASAGVWVIEVLHDPTCPARRSTTNTNERKEHDHERPDAR